MNSKRRGLVASVVVAALAGCTVGPDYREPSVNVGTGWAEPSASDQPGPDLSQWWTTFNDPTLTRLVEQALTNNRGLGQAVARVAQARALRDETTGRHYPSAEMNGSVTERRQSENGPLPVGRIPGLERDQTIYEAGFDALWEIDLFGSTRRSVEAAEARLGETVEQSRVAQLTVVAEVARTYLALRGAQRERAVYDAVVELARRTAELVRRQFQLGDVPEAPVAQADAELATLEGQVPTFDAEIRSCNLVPGAARLMAHLRWRSSTCADPSDRSERRCRGAGIRGSRAGGAVGSRARVIALQPRPHCPGPAG